MTRSDHSQSPRPADIASHYSSGYEAARLRTGSGHLEDHRTRELLARFLPPLPARILDIGGGPGGYACWLAKQGYEVHLLDISPVHVQLAIEASARQPESPLASVQVGDACSLPWDAATANAVLLFGPLYHLTDRTDRLQALATRRDAPRGWNFAIRFGL
jgi:SAM-dependent methyltransferase